MRIGINLLYLLPGIVGGTETYAVSLIKALASIDRENEYFVFLNHESANLELVDQPRFHRVICPFHATHRLVRYAWEQLILRWQLRHYRIDIVHSMGYVGPLHSSCPRVVTIHDLNYVALGDVIPPIKKYGLRFFATQSAHRSTHVITDSYFSKAQITNILKVSPDKVTTIHAGPGQVPAADSIIPWSSLQDRYKLPENYVVAFGGGSVHKNISRLIEAFELACQGLSHHLVLIGHLPPGLDLAKEAPGTDLYGRVHALGYIPATHIAPILSHADLFVLPSLYEGFGFPVLEAQSVGAPVACSKAGSLPEVAGEGAVFFDPLSVDHMAEVIRDCLRDKALRASLRNLGRQNVERFSWNKTARETLAVYKCVYGSQGSV